MNPAKKATNISARRAIKAVETWIGRVHFQRNVDWIAADIGRTGRRIKKWGAGSGRRFRPASIRMQIVAFPRIHICSGMNFSIVSLRRRSRFIDAWWKRDSFIGAKLEWWGFHAYFLWTRLFRTSGICQVLMGLAASFFFWVSLGWLSASLWRLWLVGLNLASQSCNVTG